MTTCEFHESYTNLLNTRIDELDNPIFGKKDFGSVWNVVQNIAICRCLENILPEDAEDIYKRIYELYPQFEEKIRTELKQKFG